MEPGYVGRDRVYFFRHFGTADMTPVTVAEWAERPPALAGATAFLFVPEVRRWRIVEAVESCANGGQFDLIFADGKFGTYPGTQPLHLTAQDYEMLTCGK